MKNLGWKKGGRFVGGLHKFRSQDGGPAND